LHFPRLFYISSSCDLPSPLCTLIVPYTQALQEKGKERMKSLLKS
jgi:hypothetical protein